MATGRPRGSSVFSGLTLIFVGVLLLLHNYRGFELSRVLLHWWPLLLIGWGAIKLYERAVSSRTGEAGGRTGPGEVFLVLGLVALVGGVIATDQVRDKFGPDIMGWGHDAFSRDLDVAPKPVPAKSRITIQGVHGDIAVRSSDEPEIRVNGKKSVRGWNENEAERKANAVSVAVSQNGDGYEVRPTGANDSQVSVDLEVVVPKQSAVTVRNEKGDISVVDMESPVTIDGGSGDVEVRNTSGDVSIDMRRGDAKISDTKGNVKISGSGDSVEVVGTSGSFTINGEFVGPVRAEKVSKGVRFVSHRTDLTVSQLSGHMEVGSGNLEVVDAPGNVILTTHEEEVSVENVGGKIKLDNRNGNVSVRFSSPPKEDVDITNASAAITVGLPEASNFEISADCHSGDIDSEFESDSLKKTVTQSGDSHLEGRFGTGRGPKISLKTTYGSISLHKND
jgi:Putative adhesin/Domain of unknown function (DUF5668)